MKEENPVLLETCRGFQHCRWAVLDGTLFGEDIRLLLHERGMAVFEPGTQPAARKHGLLTISVSLCPNACTRPQIADIGLIGASKPAVAENRCSGCGCCVESCREGAVMLSDKPSPTFSERCLSCGACVRACPTGALREEYAGFRIMLGGRLGRHPRLATELAGIHSSQDALAQVAACLDRYLNREKRQSHFCIPSMPVRRW